MSQHLQTGLSYCLVFAIINSENSKKISPISDHSFIRCFILDDAQYKTQETLKLDCYF